MVEILEVSSDQARPKPIIYIGTPAFGCMLSIHYVASLLRLHALCTSKGIPLLVDMTGNESLISRCRSIMQRRFLLSEATHLLWIDSDIGFDPNSVLRLLEFVERHDGNRIAGCVYAKKGYMWPRLERAMKDPDFRGQEDLAQIAMDFNINIPDEGVAVDEHGYIPVLDLATGMMMSSRKVCEAVAAAHPELHCINDLQNALPADSDNTFVATYACMIDQKSRRFLSEDYSYSRRAQDLGFTVWADLCSPLSHTGNASYMGDIRGRLRARQYDELCVETKIQPKKINNI